MTSNLLYKCCSASFVDDTNVTCLIHGRWSNLANIMHNDHASTPGTRKIVSQSKRTCGSQPVQGLYMYGGVGVGKTMLMDLFVFSATPEFRVSFRLRFIWIPN